MTRKPIMNKQRSHIVLFTRYHDPLFAGSVAFQEELQWTWINVLHNSPSRRKNDARPPPRLIILKSALYCSPSWTPTVPAAYAWNASWEFFHLHFVDWISCWICNIGLKLSPYHNLLNCWISWVPLVIYSPTWLICFLFCHHNTTVLRMYVETTPIQGFGLHPCLISVFTNALYTKKLNNNLRSVDTAVVEDKVHTGKRLPCLLWPQVQFNYTPVTYESELEK